MSAAAAAAPGFIALEGGDSRVEIVPTHGGRIRSLHLFGREWLLSDAGSAAPAAGQPISGGFGWEECAPSAGGGTMPEWVKGVGGAAMPVGGEARTQVPETTLSTDHEGHKVTCTWRGQQMPWVLTRVVLVRPDGAVEARYEALTTGRERLPFLWSAWLQFPLDANTRVRLPDGGRFRVARVEGAEMEGDVMEGNGQWPRLILDRKSRDLSTPWSVPKPTQLAAWLDLGVARAMIQLWQDDARLTLSCGGSVPYCGLWLDRSGVARSGPRRAFGRSGAPTLALAPSFGAPDRYSEALGDWQAITWLVPGEPRRWTLTIRGGTA